MIGALERSAPLVANANTGNINNNQYGLGQNIFGNSYTASIDIYNLTFPDRVRPTVYLYNTGRFTDWATYGALNIEEPLSAGQYTYTPKCGSGNLRWKNTFIERLSADTPGVLSLL